jgi:hypothetical protein
MHLSNSGKLFKEMQDNSYYAYIIALRKKIYLCSKLGALAIRKFIKFQFSSLRSIHIFIF